MLRLARIFDEGRTRIIADTECQTIKQNGVLISVERTVRLAQVENCTGLHTVIVPKPLSLNQFDLFPFHGFYKQTDERRWRVVQGVL